LKKFHKRTNISLLVEWVNILENGDLDVAGPAALLPYLFPLIVQEEEPLIKESDQAFVRSFYQKIQDK
jgi:hypothetical protein